nr:MAG TPA: hypothetical protein [Caudoviricetes sp.]
MVERDLTTSMGREDKTFYQTLVRAKSHSQAFTGSIKITY